MPSLFCKGHSPKLSKQQQTRFQQRLSRLLARQVCTGKRLGAIAAHRANHFGGTYNEEHVDQLAVALVAVVNTAVGDLALSQEELFVAVSWLYERILSETFDTETDTFRDAVGIVLAGVECLVCGLPIPENMLTTKPINNYVN